MSNKNYLTIIKEDGSEELCEILFTHYEADFDKNYVVFKPETSDELAAASYIPEGADGKLMAIETEEEWQLIEELVERYADELEDEYEDEPHHCGCGCNHDHEGCDCDTECNCDGDCDCDHEDEECKCCHHE